MSKAITQFKPGTSGNALGRPRGFAGVAKRIMRETRDGAELVEYALGVWRNPSSDSKDRWAAFAWLSDRGLGKPLQTIDLSAAIEEVPSGPPIDLSRLGADELAQLESIYRRALAPEPIDV